MLPCHRPSWLLHPLFSEQQGRQPSWRLPRPSWQLCHRSFCHLVSWQWCRPACQLSFLQRPLQASSFYVSAWLPPANPLGTCADQCGLRVGRAPAAIQRVLCSPSFSYAVSPLSLSFPGPIQLYQLATKAGTQQCLAVFRYRQRLSTRERTYSTYDALTSSKSAFLALRAPFSAFSAFSGFGLTLAIRLPPFACSSAISWSTRSPAFLGLIDFSFPRFCSRSSSSFFF